MKTLIEIPLYEDSNMKKVPYTLCMEVDPQGLVKISIKGYNIGGVVDVNDLFLLGRVLLK